MMPQGIMGTLRPEQTERAVSETAPSCPLWKGGRRRLCLGRLRGDSPFNCQEKRSEGIFGESYEDFGNAVNYRWMVGSLALETVLCWNWGSQAVA